MTNRRARWVLLTGGLVALVAGFVVASPIAYLGLGGSRPASLDRYVIVLGFVAVSIAIAGRPLVARTRTITWRPSRSWLALAVIVVLWAVLRALTLHRFPPFVDESFFAVEAHTGLVDPARRWDALYDAKGPLFNWIAMVFMGIGASPLTAVRLISAGAGLATLGMVHALGRRLEGPATGLVAAVCYALVPFFIIHDTIGVLDPLVSAMTTAALLLALRLADRPDAARAAMLGFVLGLAMLTKLNAAFALLLAPAAILLSVDRRRFAFAVLAAEVMAILVWQLERLSPVYAEARAYADRAEGLTYRSPGEVLTHPARYVANGVGQYVEVLNAYLTPSLVLALGLGVFATRRRDKALGALLLVWAIGGAMVVALLAPTLWGRYTLPSFPPLIALAALGLVAVGRWLASRRHGLIALAAIACLSFAPFVVFDARWIADPDSIPVPAARDDTLYRTGSAAGSGWGALARAVRGQMTVRPDTNLAYGTGTPWFLGVLLEDPRWVRSGDVVLLRETFTARSHGHDLRVVALGRVPNGRYDLLVWDRSAGSPPRQAIRGMARVLAIPRRHAGSLELYRRQSRRADGPQGAVARAVH